MPIDNLWINADSLLAHILNRIVTCTSCACEPCVQEADALTRLQRKILDRSDEELVVFHAQPGAVMWNKFDEENSITVR